MQDLSSMLSFQKNLMAGESESGGNTITYDKDNTAMKGPGSMPVNELPEWTDDPSLEVGPVKDLHQLVQQHGGTPTRVSATWKKAGQ